MEMSSDPYEQKLYHMFSCHDVNSTGFLSEPSLVKLCKTLELKDNQQICLLKCLLKADKHNVSFEEFKDGLLSFLGSEMAQSTDDQQLSSTITEDLNETITNSGINSPAREVSPKFVVGSKKYGRRSRPQINELTTDSSSVSDSDNEAVVPSNKVQRSVSQSDLHGTKRRRPVGGTKLKRCASFPAQNNSKMEGRLQSSCSSSNSHDKNLPSQQSSIDSLGNLDFENLSENLYEVWTTFGTDETNHTLNRSELENVCKLVGLKKIAAKVADEVFEKLNLNPQNRISFCEFISLIQTDQDMLPSDMYSNSSTLVEGNQDEEIEHRTENLLENTVSTDISESDPTVVSSDVIIDMWESSGISNAKKLLLNLGFTIDQIHVTQLSTALDDELQGLHNDVETTPLLKASLALHKAEVNALRQALRQLGAENRKLCTDNRDANRRAAIIAQEIDERHATLENTTKSEIKILEQRHSEIVRDLTKQLAVDRENWSVLTAKFEKRIKSFESEDLKLKNEITILKDENSALETEQTSLQQQFSDILESNISLNNEISDLEEKYKNDESLKNQTENEEVLELIEKITKLQIENVDLRDKNDELSSEIEGLNMELIRFKTKKSTKITSGVDETDENVSESSLSVAVKRRGDSPSKIRVTEESPRLGKLRKCNDDNNGTESEPSGDWMPLNSELCQTLITNSSGFSQDFSSLNDSGKEDELKDLRTKIQNLEKEIEDCKKIDTDGKDVEKIKMEQEKSHKMCLELEGSLEQMRKAYEDCEDYWQGKLNEERQLYEEEQRVSDEKFNELLKKMSEYEEQFSSSDKNGRLTPIDEKGFLEQQFVELEEEIKEVKINSQKILDEKSSEITKLQEKLKYLQIKMTESELIVNTTPPPRVTTPDLNSSASSPISYLFSQSTIHQPARDYHNPNWNKKEFYAEQQQQIGGYSDQRDFDNSFRTIRKPQSPSNNDNADNVSVVSNKSGHSIASTYSIHKSVSRCSSPSVMKEDIKKLKLVENQVKDEIRDLVIQRDGLVMELQQLKEAKPVLEKSFARTNHPNLTAKVQQLEMKNRHLQNALRQQHQYVESIMHQTWQQQRSEIIELRKCLEQQNMVIAAQAQKLTDADILVKEMYVENSNLMATIQQLRTRAGILQMQHQSLSGLSGMQGGI